MKLGRNFIPAYNAQAVTTTDHVIVAAERDLEDAGVAERVGVVLADAGHWSNGHIDAHRAVRHATLAVCVTPRAPWLS